MSSGEREKLPPKWANQFLEWYCDDGLIDEIQGDLFEAYYYRKQEVGWRKAKWWFVWDVLKFCRPSSFKKKSNNPNSVSMLKNNIKIALRIISRKKWASFINIISLTLGITAVTLISFFVADEFSFDDFHEKNDSIYRLVTDRYLPDGSYDYTDASQPLPLAEQLVADFSEIDAVSRVSKGKRYLRSDGNTQEENVLLVDSSFFKTFSFPLLLGNENTAMEFSESVVVSEDLAMRYFQSIDVLGKIIEIRHDEIFKKYQITGVVANVPSNSSFQFDVVMNYDQTSYYSWASNSWGVRIDEIYVELSDNVNVATLNDKVKDYWKKYLTREAEESKTYKGDYQNYWLQPLSDVHMASDVGSTFSTSDPMNSYILSGIAAIILLIGCANFTILSIGRATMRGKEVAVRKVVGAKKPQLIIQFWVEAITMSFLAMALSVGLVFLLLPAFNTLAEKSFVANDLLNTRLLITLPLIALITGLGAGTYPALILSGVKVLDFFKKKMKLGGANLFTKSLITTQFSLSVMLLLGAIIVFQQIDFFKGQDLGYDNTNVIVLENTMKAEPERMKVFENVLAGNPKIDSWTGMSSSFGRGGFSSVYEKPDGTEFNYSVFFVEPSFFDVLGIDILAGRNFNELSSADSNSIIVNETFLEKVAGDFQLEDNLTDFKNMGLTNPKIIGVANDFHFQSLANQLKPVVLLLSSSKKSFYNFLIKTNGAPDSELLQFLEESWYEVAPDSPYSYAFMNEDIEGQYQAEMRWFTIVKYATIWALGLAILGLLGIVGMSITGRLKELSIRKVLGADTLQLYYILSRQFFVLLVIAAMIGIPTTVYFANGWLENFAYHIELNPLVFSGVLTLILLLIMVIIYLGASRVLKSNPIDSLRME
ncbi:ABC transporter permease [Roseivirga sp. E12]|uniref:ABC transporter permease n=1 Tax=Roseivirga sp. E12 TaxID=2819237 RepID=UPI001ABC5B29|nr:ABC transporter permease [Roseivirga sp. E12]MBO3700725.1 ABC transporter permease [Roseivirga sp. E12]